MINNYPTTGRPMTGALQRALDGVAPEDRHAVAVALRANGGRLAAVFAAIATEIELVGLRQVDQDIEFRRMTQDALDAPPPPPPTGPALRFDPETGEFIELPTE